MGDPEPPHQREHQLDLPGGLWTIPDLKQAHPDLRRLHDERPENEPLLPVQHGYERHRAAELQDAHSVELLPEAAEGRRRWQALLRGDKLTRLAHLRHERLRVGFHR